MGIDPDDLKAMNTQQLMDAKFAPPPVNTRAESLAKARAAKAAKAAKAAANVVSHGDTQHQTSPIQKDNFTNALKNAQLEGKSEAFWREAMVAQMVNGRCIHPKQLQEASAFAEAYSKLAMSKFS